MSHLSHLGLRAGRLIGGILLAALSACDDSKQATPAPKQASPGAVRIADDASAVASQVTDAGTGRDDAASTLTENADLAPPDTPLGQLQRLEPELGDRKKARELHSAALKRHRRRAYADAERIWIEAARTDPSWDWPFYNLACATALQGRPDEAVSYLQLVAKRQVSFRRLRKIETDPDLKSIRDRKQVRAIVLEIAEQLLVGPHSALEGQLPAGVAPAPRCETFTLYPAGAFVQQCADQYTSTGRWMYADGALYLNIKAQQSTCENDESCPPQTLNDYAALQITRLDDQFLCLKRTSRMKWPVRREPGQLIRAPKRSIKSGCYE